MKGKYIPKKIKDGSFSQKGLVVLIIIGVALTVLALGIVIKAPEKPKTAELSKNKVTSRIIAMPMPALQSQDSAPPDLKEKNSFPWADRGVVLSESEETPAPFYAKSTIEQDSKIEEIEEEGSESEDPEAEDFEMQDPEAEDFEMQDPETEDFEMQDPETEDFEMQDPETEDLEMENSEAEDSEMRNLKADSSKIEKSNPQNTTPRDPVAKPSTPTPVAPAKRPFTVQVGVFRVDVYADRMAARLKERYYRSFVHEVIGKDQQPLYLVCFGRFETRKAAAQAARDFIEKENMDAVAAFLKPR